MAWLDDRLYVHPKWVGLSLRAWKVGVTAILYSHGFGLYGKLEPSQVRAIGCTEVTRSELIGAGLWETDGETVLIHDWDEHNGNRDRKLEERRQTDRERKRKEREALKAEKRPQDVQRTSEESPSGKSGMSSRAGAGARLVTNDRVKKELRSFASDELWDVLEVELGEAVTASERGRRNKALKELRDIGATPGQVHKRCKAYRRMWPDITLTATALAANWTTLMTKEPQVQPIEAVLELPDISDEDRAANLERIRELSQAISQEAV